MPGCMGSARHRPLRQGGCFLGVADERTPQRIGSRPCRVSRKIIGQGEGTAKGEQRGVPAVGRARTGRCAALRVPSCSSWDADNKRKMNAPALWEQRDGGPSVATSCSAPAAKTACVGHSCRSHGKNHTHQTSLPLVERQGRCRALHPPRSPV